MPIFVGREGIRGDIFHNIARVFMAQVRRRPRWWVGDDAFGHLLDPDRRRRGRGPSQRQAGNGVLQVLRRGARLGPMCASATPDDADLDIVRRRLDVGRFQRVSVLRSRVVDARLDKPRVKAVSFVSRGASADLLDLSEVALRKAVEQHRVLKRLLKQAAIPIVPLLLVQASSSDWTPAKAEALLRGPLQFPADAVAVHTAAEPDPDVQALANDPEVEVLVLYDARQPEVEKVVLQRSLNVILVQSPNKGEGIGVPPGRHYLSPQQARRDRGAEATGEREA